MNLFKKYVTPVLLVAIVASCSSIEAIDFSYWLDRVRSGASQAYDVLKRKKVWVPIVATTGTVLCLLKMTYSGKKIWQKKIDSDKAKHEDLCIEIKGLDSKDDDLFNKFCVKQNFIERLRWTMYLPSLADSFFIGLLDGVHIEPAFDPDTQEFVDLPAPELTRIITNPIRAYVNCTANVSQRLARRLTDINGEIDEQQKRIERTLKVLRDLGGQLSEKKEDEFHLSQKHLNDSEKETFSKTLGQLKFNDGALELTLPPSVKGAKK